MKIVTETRLTDFVFWCGAKDNASMLTYEEMEEVETMLEEICDGEITDTYINDLFWFDFEFICSLIGYKYNVEEDIIIREEIAEEEE